MDIKQIRLKAEISQKKLSQITNIPLSTIRSWEQGFRTPPPYMSELIECKLEAYFSAQEAENNEKQ